MTALTIDALTQATLDGTGIFDVLMRANKAHLEAEFAKNRIKGAEYATVYLGSLESVMQHSLSFLLQREKIALEAELMAQQILLGQIALQKANVELAILQASQAKIPAEIALLEQQKLNLVSENLLTQGKTTQTTQQTENLAAEGQNLVKQGTILTNQAAQIAQETLNLASQKLHVEAQTTLVTQQKTNLVAEALIIPKQGAKLDADTAVSTQQKLNLAAEKLLTDAKATQAARQTENLVAEGLNIPKQGALLDKQALQVAQQTTNLTAEKLFTEGKTNLTTQQTANAVLEGNVLSAQECKLKAEFDVLMNTKLKVAEETTLLTQKTATEKAQTVALGVDDNSVVGRQKILYKAQADGFTRDAEQKAAKLLVDTWNVRRTTDEGTVADGTNKLDDATIGRAVTKLLTGVGA